MHSHYTHRTSALPGGPLGGLPSLSLTTKGSWRRVAKPLVSSLTPVPPSLKVMEVVATTRAIRHAKLQLNRHHQQTNTQFFTGQMSFLSPNQQRQSTEGKISAAGIQMQYIFPLVCRPRKLCRPCSCRCCVDLNMTLYTMLCLGPHSTCSWRALESH